MKAWHVCVALALAALCFLGGDFRGRIAQGGPAGRIATYTEHLDEQTTDFTSRSYDVAEARHLVMTVEAKVKSGTGSCSCFIESSTDRVNWFETFTVFPALVSEGNAHTTQITKGYKMGNVEGMFHRHVRVNCALIGTNPAYTISVYTTGSP